VKASVPGRDAAFDDPEAGAKHKVPADAGEVIDMAAGCAESEENARLDDVSATGEDAGAIALLWPNTGERDVSRRSSGVR